MIGRLGGTWKRKQGLAPATVSTPDSQSHCRAGPRARSARPLWIWSREASPPLCCANALHTTHGLINGVGETNAKFSKISDLTECSGGAQCRKKRSGHCGCSPRQRQSVTIWSGCPSNAKAYLFSSNFFPQRSRSRVGLFESGVTKKCLSTLVNGCSYTSEAVTT
jgi:hypothetical protein